MVQCPLYFNDVKFCELTSAVITVISCQKNTWWVKEKWINNIIACCWSSVLIVKSKILILNTDVKWCGSIAVGRGETQHVITVHVSLSLTWQRQYRIASACHSSSRDSCWPIMSQPAWQEEHDLSTWSPVNILVSSFFDYSHLHFCKEICQPDLLLQKLSYIMFTTLGLTKII